MMERHDVPEPCTDDAINDGCTCQMGHVYPTHIDPPEPVIDPWCPLHGTRDPDYEYERRRDDADERRRDQPAR